MADGRQLSVSEMKRILKPGGQAYLNIGAPPWGFVNKVEWEQTLEGFKVELGGSWQEKWAVVSLKQDL